eukprot:scaffold23590_cov55-Phaeocystis_antarctica.AAC.2
MKGTSPNSTPPASPPPAPAPPARGGRSSGMGWQGSAPHETFSAILRAQVRQPSEDGEALPQPVGLARQAVVALEQQEEVAAREAREPVVRADLVDVRRRDHKVVGLPEQCQPPTVAAPAVVVDDHLELRRGQRRVQPRRQLPRVGAVTKGLHDRAHERAVGVTRAVADGDPPLGLPRRAAWLQKQLGGAARITLGQLAQRTLSVQQAQQLAGVGSHLRERRHHSSCCLPHKFGEETTGHEARFYLPSRRMSHLS